MNAQKITFTLCLLLFGVGTINAQKFKERKANKHFERFEFAEAAPLYESLKKKNPTAEIVYRLAQCYQRMNQYDKALTQYEYLENNFPDTTFYYIDYGLLLKTASEYQHAENVFKQFLLKDPGDDRSAMVLDLIVSCKKAEALLKNKLGVYIKSINVNTENNDFSPFLWNEKLLFTSSRKASGNNYKYDNESFLQMYSAVREANEVFEEPVLMPDPLNASLHDGPVMYSNRFSAAFITRNDENFELKNTENEHRLQIYYSNYEKGEWQELKPFQHNQNNTSTGHAAITPSGKYFFFASDRNGGKGATDLYMCSYSPSGWSNPKNLGDLVNTPGQELFPYAYNDSILFFSSDRHVGLGELDIFKAVIKNGEVVRVENLGAPINSNKDDFGFFLEDNKTFQGYFSSNRDGSKGGDDIYFFKKSIFSVKSLVVDSVTYDPIALGDVRIRNKAGEVRESFTNRNGKTNITLGPDDEFVLSFSKIGYKVKRININTQGLVESKDTALIVELIKGNSAEFQARVIDKITRKPISGANVELNYVGENYKEELISAPQGDISYVSDMNDPINFSVSHPGYFSQIVKATRHERGKMLTIELVPMELNKPIEIENIYYEFDKWNITPQAKVTLNKIVTLMHENPNITIELGSHTDIRGTDSYNYDLSIRRAKEAIKYIVSSGIDRIRLSYDVYGEKRVAVPCPPGIDCDDDVHQKNRRTEFRITSF